MSNKQNFVPTFNMLDNQPPGNFYYVNASMLKSEIILKNLCGDLVQYVGDCPRSLEGRIVGSNVSQVSPNASLTNKKQKKSASFNSVGMRTRAQKDTPKVVQPLRSFFVEWCIPLVFFCIWFLLCYTPLSWLSWIFRYQDVHSTLWFSFRCINCFLYPAQLWISLIFMA